MTTTTTDASGRRPNAGLAIGAVVFVCLFAIGTFSARDPDFDLLFGVEGYRLLGVPVFVFCAAALLVIVLVPGVAGSLARLLAAAVGRIPLRARLPLLLLGSGAAFYGITNYNASGDSGSVVMRLSLEMVYPSNALTNWVFHALSLLGLDPREAIRITSCLAGILFALAARGIGREAFPDGPRRAAVTGLLLTSGTAGLFFGTLEVYPLLVAGSAFYLWLGLRWLNGNGRGIWPPLCLGVVFWLHMSAGLLLPSLGLLANRGRFWPIDLWRWVKWGILFLIPVAVFALCLFLFTWSGALPEAGPDRYGTLLGAGDEGMLLPLTFTPFDPFRRYAVFDLEHFVGVLNLLALVAPAGLLLLFIGRRPWRSGTFRFIAVAALFLVLFPNFWNISFELRRDWDLFSGMGVPLVLLGALAFFSVSRPRSQVVRVLAVSVFCFLPQVLSNHVDPGHRREYSRLLGEQSLDTVLASASTAAAVLAADSAGDHSPLVLEQVCDFAIRRSGAFRVSRPGLDPARFKGDLTASLAGVRWPAGIRADPGYWAERITEEARNFLAEIYSGRQSSPGPGMFAYAAVSRALVRVSEEGGVGSKVAALALEPFLLDAVDCAVHRQGMFEFDAPRFELKRLGETVEEAIAEYVDPETPIDAGAVVASITRTLNIRRAEEEGLRWVALLRTVKRWDGEAAKLKPPGFAAAFNRAEQVSTWDPARAEDLVRHLLERVPGDPACLALHGALLTLQGRLEDAKEVLREAIAAYPTNLHPRFYVAWILDREGNRDDAIACLSRSLRVSGGGLNPQAPRLLMLLARLRRENGEDDIARALYEIALDRLHHTPGNVPQRDMAIKEARAALKALSR